MIGAASLAGRGCQSSAWRGGTDGTVGAKPVTLFGVAVSKTGTGWSISQPIMVGTLVGIDEVGLRGSRSDVVFRNEK